MSNEYLDIAMEKVIKQEVNAVLDKIRAEIEETELNITYEENHKVGGTWGLRKASDIIDKHISGK